MTQEMFVRFGFMILNLFVLVNCYGDTEPVRNPGAIVRITDPGLLFVEKILVSQLFNHIARHNTSMTFNPFVTVTNPADGSNLGTELRSVMLLGVDSVPQFRNTFLPPNKINILVTELCLKLKGEFAVAELGSVRFSSGCLMEFLNVTWELVTDDVETTTLKVADCSSEVLLKNVQVNDDDIDLSQLLELLSKETVNAFICGKIDMLTKKAWSYLGNNPLVPVSDLLDLPFEGQVLLNLKLMKTTQVTRNSLDLHILAGFQSSENEPMNITQPAKMNIPQHTENMFVVYIDAYPLNTLAEILFRLNASYTIRNTTKLIPAHFDDSCCVSYMFRHYARGGREQADRLEVDLIQQSATKVSFTSTGVVDVEFHVKTYWYAIHEIPSTRTFMAEFQSSSSSIPVQLILTEDTLKFDISHRPKISTQKTKSDTKIRYFRTAFARIFEEIVSQVNSAQLEFPAIFKYNIGNASINTTEGLFEFHFDLTGPSFSQSLVNPCMVGNPCYALNDICYNYRPYAFVCHCSDCKYTCANESVHAYDCESHILSCPEYTAQYNTSAVLTMTTNIGDTHSCNNTSGLRGLFALWLYVIFNILVAKENYW